jgi:hypothetical protein
VPIWDTPPAPSASVTRPLTHQSVRDSTRCGGEQRGLSEDALPLAAMQSDSVTLRLTLARMVELTPALNGPDDRVAWTRGHFIAGSVYIEDRMTTVFHSVLDQTDDKRVWPLIRTALLDPMSTMPRITLLAQIVEWMQMSDSFPTLERNLKNCEHASQLLRSLRHLLRALRLRALAL